MSLDALDEVRAVERQADDILRDAGERARSKAAAAEDESKRIAAEAHKRAAAEGEQIAAATRAKIARKSENARKAIEAKESEVRKSAKANWERAVDVAVRRVVKSVGNR